jgi:hypothetical protein
MLPTPPPNPSVFQSHPDLFELKRVRNSPTALVTANITTSKYSSVSLMAKGRKPITQILLRSHFKGGNAQVQP